jgi:PAS domain S-box-containing protein
VNRAVYDKLGYTEEELFSRPIATFIHPDDRDITGSTRAKMLEGEALLNFENRYLTSKGDHIWLAWTSVYFPDKELVFAIAKDVTARKEAEKSIEEKYMRYKSMATHFKSSIEEDRKYLATELHEELAQLAAVVKMDIDWIGLNVPAGNEATKKRIEHASVVANLLMNGMRRISFTISPTMLAEQGLHATLIWLCKEFAVLNGLPCTFESDYDEDLLDLEIKTDFFRICQESLSNVMYHAEAKEVWVRLEEVGNKIQLAITDNGKGFIPDDHNPAPGLHSMRERAASINGTLRVESELGKGTMVCVSIPK